MGWKISSSLNYGLPGEDLVWLTEAVVCLFAANRGSNLLMDGRLMHCDIISSYQSVATSEIVKSAFGLESVSCKKRYSKYFTLLLLYFTAALGVS